MNSLLEPLTSDDEYWFEDALAPGYAESSFAELVSESGPRFVVDPLYELAIRLGLYRHGTSVYLTA